MYVYFNNNPWKRSVNDCVIRAISLAENKSWDKVYDELSILAKDEAILLDDITFVDNYLDKKYKRICYKCKGERITIKEFIKENRRGTYLITMQGHITCVINGILFDTWNCSNKRIWSVWRVL